MEIDSYLVFKIGAIAVFIFFGSLCLKKKNFPLINAFFLTSIAALSGFFVSRLWYIVQNFFGSEPYNPPDLAAAWNDAGSVLYGWILGGLVTVVLFSKIWKWSLLKVSDTLVPWALAGQILNRFGCYSAGCCFGKPGHPVQLYEAAWDVVVLGLLWHFSKSKEGRASFLYFTGYAAGRFVLEFFRGDNQPAMLGMTVPQITSVAIIICAIIFSKSKNRVGGV